MDTVKQTLLDIAGRERICDERETLRAYSRDQSFSPARMPDFVVFPETVDEIQRIVRLANATRTPVIPYSSGLNFHGAALPDHGGIILNLSRMNRILELNEANWFVIIEPGVTYAQLQQKLMEKNYRVMIPFGAAPARSVLSSYLERDPVMAAASFEYGNYLILDTELVLPDGEIFRTGLWASGGKAGGALGPVRNDVFRLWTGAQGTLGIMTKMALHINPFIRQRKVFFISFHELAEAVEPVKTIQRRQIGTECFLLNRFNMAALLSSEWTVPDHFPVRPGPSQSFETLKALLPPWLLTICINGSPRHPEEKIAYEERALRETCASLNIELMDRLPGAHGFDRIILEEILYPWSILKKFNYRGSVHSLCFKSPMQRVVELEGLLHAVCGEHGYRTSSVGAYILPMERGRALHCEFDLHCDLEDARETQMVKDIWLKASAALMDRGAFFDRPYGAWARMVFQRAGNHTLKLREIKNELDPCGILNPGKLFF